MFDAGKILALGGADSYEMSLGKTAASVITIGGAGTPPSAKATGSMAFARAFCTSVPLPDGKVVTIGGMPYPIPFADTDAVLPAGAALTWRLRCGCC
jgi:galactose oxidase